MDLEVKGCEFVDGVYIWLFWRP